MRDVFILGSTGSIGTQALAVIAKHSGSLRVEALTAGGNVGLLAEQAALYQPRYVGIAKADAASRFSEIYSQVCKEKGIAGQEVEQPEIFVGADASAQIAALAKPGQTVLNGITGGVGLLPTLNALQSGATLALANKESLVVGGALVKQAMQTPGQIVPVDSEHSAIAQALLSGHHHRGLIVPQVDGTSAVSKIILTASGGPFRGKRRADLKDVTAAQALNHPTWSMGPVVTINSSTLMNKALELIEAHLLFDVPPDDIIPVIHPQSLIHSAVTWCDGSTIAQVSRPDMALPIALGMTWPERLGEITTPLDWSAPQSWTFEPVDYETFPAIELARQALSASATHPAVFNASNEVFVEAFLQGCLGYLEIVDGVGEVLAKHSGMQQPALEDILEAENWARARSKELIAKR